MGKEAELIEAARIGNVAIVEKIFQQKNKRSGFASLRRGPGVNSQDSTGYTALHHSALNGHIQVVRILLANDASPKVTDSRGASPLHLAAWAGHQEICKILLTNAVPANPNLQTIDNETPLHFAAQHGHTGALTTLLAYGAIPIVQNSNLETPLDLASQYGRLEVVQILICAHPELLIQYQEDQQVYVETDTVQGTRSIRKVFNHTPLHLASRNGHKNVVDLLLKAGCFVNLLTQNGTALHEAALCGKDSCVRLLLNDGADLEATNANGQTPLDLLKEFPPHVTKRIVAVIKNHARYAQYQQHGNGADDYVDDDDDYAIDNGGTDDYGCGDDDEQYLNENGDIVPYGYGNDSDSDHEARAKIKMRAKHSTSREYYDYSANAPNASTFRGHNYQNIRFHNTDQSGSGYGVNSTMSPSSSSIGSSYAGPQSPSPSRYKQQFQPQPAIRRHGSREDELSTNSSDYYTQMVASTRRIKHEHGDKMDLRVQPLKPPRRHVSVSPPSNPQSSKSEEKFTSAKPSSRNKQSDLLMSKSFDSSTFQAKMNENASPSRPGPYEFLYLSKTGNRGETYQGKPRNHHPKPPIHDRPTVIKSDYEVMTPPKLSKHKTNAKKIDPHEMDMKVDEMLQALTLPVTPKSYNPNRKLRRNRNSGCSADGSNGSFCDPNSDRNEPISIDQILTNKDNARVRISSTTPKLSTPLSPTNYIQPATPDHPPPSAHYAAQQIQERIRPLSQEYKRLSGIGYYEGIVKPPHLETDSVEKDDILTVITTSPVNGSSVTATPTTGKGTTTILMNQSLGASSGSLNSSVSYTDSTDCVEEYIEDRPFGGLFKGSTMDVNSIGATTKKPPLDQLLFKDMNFFTEDDEWSRISEIMASFTCLGSNDKMYGVLGKKSAEDDKIPFKQRGTLDDQHKQLVEWLKSMNLEHLDDSFISHGFDNVLFINNIINTDDLKHMNIKVEFHEKIMNGVQSLDEFERNFMNNKFAEKTIEQQEISTKESSSTETNNNHNSSNTTNPSNAHNKNNNNALSNSFIISFVNWLQRIHLYEEYFETFTKHLYTDLKRVSSIWESELRTVLEIQRIGHRKRILLSFNDQINSKESKSETLPNAVEPTQEPQLSKMVKKIDVKSSSIVKRHKKNRPAPKPPCQVVTTDPPNKSEEPKNDSLDIRQPTDLLLNSMRYGLLKTSLPITNSTDPLTDKISSEQAITDSSLIMDSQTATSWQHSAISLITNQVKYEVNYLGSTRIMELRGTESTRKSIQKLKRDVDITRRATEHKKLAVILAISYKGVQFIDVASKEVICEHEIRNINCACQDAEDFTYFAYITKDMQQQTHYCHVFFVDNTSLATEIILTLGQAFEVAYQIVLKETAGIKPYQPKSISNCDGNKQ